MQKTTMQNGADDLDQSASSASSSLHDLAEAAKQLLAYFEKMSGNTGGGGGASVGSGGQMASPGYIGSAGQAACPLAGAGWSSNIPAFNNSVFQTQAAALFTQSSAQPNPSSTMGGGGYGGGQATGYMPLRDAQGRFMSPNALPGMAGGAGGGMGGSGGTGSAGASPAGVVPPTATGVGIPASGFSPPRNAQGQFVSPNGTNSASAPAGSGFNASQFSPFAPGMGGGLLHYGLNAAASTAAQVIDYSTNVERTGRADVMGAGRLAGASLGGILGAAIGMWGGPVGAMAGAGVGATIGGAIGGYFTAPLQNRIDVADNLRILKGTVGSTAFGGLDPKSTGTRDIRFNLMRDINGADKLGPYGYQTADLAKGYATVSEGMLLGGLSPYDKVGSRVYGPSAEDIKSGFDDYASGHNGSIPIGKATKRIIDRLGIGQEERGEAITRRAFHRYRNRGGEVLQDVSRVYADMPDVGDNTVDRIGKYGPLKSMEYERLQNDEGTLPMPEKEFISFSKGIRENRRNLRRAGLQTRGSAQAGAKNLQGQLDLIDKTADGKDSMLHAETAAELREAGRAAFDEKSITSYAIPMAKLEGQLARAEAMPYSPSNVMSLSLQHIKMSDQRAGELSSYMAQRKKSGQLSEREELDLTQQIQSAKTAADMDRTRLSEGVESRLPAMLAGGNSFSARFTTPMLAAMALQASGNNAVRFLGAANGQHLKAQDDFYAGDQGNTSLMAHSRTQGFNAIPPGQRGGAAGQRAASASSPVGAASRGTGGTGKAAASQDAGEPVRASASASGDSAGASGDNAGASASSPNRRWSREEADAYQGAPGEKASSKAWVGQHGGQVDTDKDGRVQTYDRDGARVYGRDVQGDPLAALRASTGYVAPKPNTYLAPKGRIGKAGNPDGPQGDFGGWDVQPVQKMTGGTDNTPAPASSSGMDDSGAPSSSGGTGETNDLLRQIRDLLSQGGGKGRGGRADEALSSLSDMMNRNGAGGANGGFTPSFN